MALVAALRVAPVLARGPLRPVSGAARFRELGVRRPVFHPPHARVDVNEANLAVVYLGV